MLVLVTSLSSPVLFGRDDLAARRSQLSTILQQEWEHTLQVNPELATHAGDDRYNDRLSDYSAEFFAREIEHSRQVLERIEPIDTAGFPEQEKLNKILMVRILRQQIVRCFFARLELRF